LSSGTVPEVGRRTLPDDYKSAAVAVNPAVELCMMRVKPSGLQDECFIARTTIQQISVNINVNMSFHCLPLCNAGDRGSSVQLRGVGQNSVSYG